MFGDVMLDRYIWGEANRLSPEAPVPIVEVKRNTRVLGGAANVANNVVQLGADCVLVGVVGDDPDGAAVREELAARSIPPGDIVTDRGRPTTVKTRIVASGQQIVRIDLEERAPLPDSRVSAILARVRWHAAQADVCVISDYQKGVVSRFTAQAVISQFRDQGRPVIVDPKGHDWERYQGATLITPNRHEASVLLGRPLETHEELVEGGQELVQRLDGTAVIITLGADGMALFRPDSEPLFVAAISKNVHDVTGAGDTVVATLAVCLAQGHQLSESVRTANVAAGLVVAKIGTSTINAAELAVALERTGSDAPADSHWKGWNAQPAARSALLEKMSNTAASRRSIVPTSVFGTE